jgi:hypothetical protein
MSTKKKADAEQKKKARNFTPAEEESLLALAVKYSKIIECKKTDAAQNRYLLYQLLEQ